MSQVSVVLAPDCYCFSPRIEAMTTRRLAPLVLAPGIQRTELTRLAISIGSEAMVDWLTQKLRKDGFPIEDGPRRTGDGYYESVVLDHDGNRIEIAVWFSPHTHRYWSALKTCRARRFVRSVREVCEFCATA